MIGSLGAIADVVLCFSFGISFSLFSHLFFWIEYPITSAARIAIIIHNFTHGIQWAFIESKASMWNSATLSCPADCYCVVCAWLCKSKSTIWRHIVDNTCSRVQWTCPLEPMRFLLLRNRVFYMRQPKASTWLSSTQLVTRTTTTIHHMRCISRIVSARESIAHCDSSTPEKCYSSLGLSEALGTANCVSTTIDRPHS